MASEQRTVEDAVLEQLFRHYGQPILSYLNRVLGDSRIESLNIWPAVQKLLQGTGWQLEDSVQALVSPP